MKVKELITKLLDFPLDSEVEFKAYNEDTETFLCSQKNSDIQICSIFPNGSIYDKELVVIHIDPCYEGSEE